MLNQLNRRLRRLKREEEEWMETILQLYNCFL